MSDNSSMLFIVTILLLFSVIMGYVTKARLWNLLSIAPAMYIALAFINSAAIVIFMIGIIFYQIFLTVRS